MLIAVSNAFYLANLNVNGTPPASLPPGLSRAEIVAALISVSNCPYSLVIPAMESKSKMTRELLYFFSSSTVLIINLVAA